MDWQLIADTMGAMTCIVSIEKFENGEYGNYCIVSGNKAYVDSIEHPAPGAEMLTDKFTPGLEYTTYLTRDLNFENACFEAAVNKKCVHSYVSPDRFGLWFNMTFLPLNSDEDNKFYCSYTMEIGFEAESEKMTKLSGEISGAVLDTCIKLRGTTDFKSTIKDVVNDIREICDSEHCCILLMDDINRRCEVLGEAFSEGSKLLPMDRYLDENFYNIADSWESTVIAGSNCLIAKDDRDMDVVKERNRIWYDSLKSASANNIVLFPLRNGETLLGYMWAINFNSDKATRIKETLELTTFILGSEIANYLMLDRLKVLSSRDMLTGVLNRNEMNNLVDSLASDKESNKSVGVIFADLNGLKAVNDAEGHPAGDQLLKDAAKALCEVFDAKNIYRAGGDEFSIILTDITKQQLDKKVKMIREVSKKYDRVSFAIGAHVMSDNKNIRTALRLADEHMYEDKKAFYERFPDKKRVVRDLINMQ